MATLFVTFRVVFSSLTGTLISHLVSHAWLLEGFSQNQVPAFQLNNFQSPPGIPVSAIDNLICIVYALILYSLFFPH